MTGEEKDEYIGVALDKAHFLKDFVESLFEWVKLDAKEQIFQFEICDLNELSRDILADWIPTLEDKQFTYEIDIPDAEYSIRLDRNAYTRVLNNLLQNALLHSEGDKIVLQILEDEKQANIIVTDNGKGIPEKDLPHIFERLYQCDESRRVSGNGLGLSIVQELLAKQPNISPHQLSYVTHSGEGEGLLFYGNVILPFARKFPKDTRLYRMMTTKPGEVTSG